MDTTTTDTQSSPSKLGGDKPRRKPRGFKIALMILAILLALFAATIIFLPYVLPVGTIRSIAKNQAKSLAGMDLDFRDLRFAWNGNVVLDDISLAPLGDDGSVGEPLLTVKEVRTNVALIPLLSGKAVVNSVDVDGFVLRVVRQPDGSMNIPDLEKLGIAAAPDVLRNGDRTRVLFSAAMAAETAALPPIELHAIRMRNGTVAFEDLGQNISLDLGVDELDVKGKTLDDPFVFSGRILPYRDAPNEGDITFSGSAAMVRNGAFNPDGEASIEAAVNNFVLNGLAEKFNVDHLLVSAQAHGLVKIGYAERKGGINIPDLRLTDAAVGLGNGGIVTLPDTGVALDALFDPDSGDAEIASASLINSLFSVEAAGTVANALILVEGAIPETRFEFSGSANFSEASRYLETQHLGIDLDVMPQLEGAGSFLGRLALPAAAPGAAMSPTLALEFDEGSLQALDSTTGIAAGVELRGVGLQAAATIEGDAIAATSRVTLAGVPVQALVPQLGSTPFNAAVNGGAALDYGPDRLTVELRLNDTAASLPATPFTVAGSVGNVAAHITADLVNDTITIHSADATINETIRGAVSAGTLRGVLAGSPSGVIDVQTAALLDQIREFVAPVFPHDMVPQVSGTLRASTRLTVENAAAQAMVRSEIDGLGAVVNFEPMNARGQVQSEKATVALMASTSLDNPMRLTLRSLEAAAGQFNVRLQDATGRSVTGQTGNGVVKLAAVVDADALTAEISVLSVDLGGMALSFVENGDPVATLASGLMKIVAAAPDRVVHAPLDGTGDFALPALDFGVDDFVFHHTASGSQPARLGSLRARLSVDGYIGQEKRQILNVRTASLSATPMAVNSRAQVDLGSGAFLAEYAARVAPAGLSSLLVFMGLPPSLLTDASVTGTVEFDGNRLSSKGSAQGQMQITQDQLTPFETAHDLTAAWNPAARSPNLGIRRLDGSIKTASGEAVATMAAQPSQLLLSHAGSRGMLDIRVNGSAGPTRAMVLGLAGVFPQLGSVANTLHTARAEGIYNAWLQIREKDPVTLGINIGGTWKGAALTLNNVPFLAEAGELSAALEGDLAYQQNMLNISRLFVSSQSAQMRGDGMARLVYTSDDSRLPTGLHGMETEMTFRMEDLSRAARVFPGVIPGDMGLAGRVEGTFRAGGDANNVQVHQAEVRFQGFRAVPMGDMEVSIPSGAATFGASMAFHFAGHATGSPFDIFRMFDVRGGQANLTGAMVRDKQISNMSCSFQLEGGRLTLSNAQVAIGGGAEGSVQMDGVVDFNGPQPAANLRLALRNIPLSEFNSEIKDFLVLERGVLNLPASQGGTANIAFVGMTEDDILRTLRLENFTFSTGPITMHTGPVLNQELDKARGLMRQKIDSANQSRQITLRSVEGSAVADGTGVITFPESSPINVLGDNTGDFRVTGSVRADRTLALRAMVVGNLEKLIGFTLPNLIPSLRQDPEASNRFMARMNENAARGHYGVNIQGNLNNPDISGISELALRFIADMATGLPGQLIGGVLDLGKDAPQALRNLGEGVVGGLLNPTDTLRNAPENIVRTPENVVKGLGQMFGIGRGRNGDGGGDEEAPDDEPQQEERRSRLPFGIR